MTTDLILVGCGGHASVVADAALSRPGAFRIRGFVADRRDDDIAARVGAPYLGDDAAYFAAFTAAESPHVVVAVGGTSVSDVRRVIAERYERWGASFAAVVHATAWVSPSARIEPGAVVLAGAIVNSGAVVGAHAIVNTGAIVEHDVTIGPFAALGPGTIVGGGARIGAHAFVGLGARVRDHVAVGARTLVGMGAVVVRDVDDDARVLGVPARAFVASRAGIP